jgi:hypothetical protein
MQLERQAANDERDRQRQTETDARAHQIEMERLAMERYLKELDIASRERIEAAKLQATLQTAEMQRNTTLETTAFNAQQAEKQAVFGANQAAEAKKPPKPDSSLMNAVNALNERFGKVEAHMTSPRKKVRDAAGKLVGVEVNGVVIPIQD